MADGRGEEVIQCQTVVRGFGNARFIGSSRLCSQFATAIGPAEAAIKSATIRGIVINQRRFRVRAKHHILW